MAHPDGERATARAAARCGALMTLSSITSVALDEVAAAAPGAPRWFQLYHFSDRGLTRALVERAAAAGYRALVLTVDTPLLGRRERDLRVPFAMPDGVSAVHFSGVEPNPSGATPIAQLICQPAISWRDLEWIRSLSALPLVLKGVVRADDACRAVDAGASGLWVSNHGGRQLDTAIPTAEALPDVVDAVAGRIPIVVDGGVRRGTDVLKALALGAAAVAIGRPQLWALAEGGEAGVTAMLEMLREELSLAMALAGCRNLAEIDRSLVRA
jgi:4-hydroxymandelate oxidase